MSGARIKYIRPAQCQELIFIFALSIYHTTQQLGIWVYYKGPRSRLTQKSFNVTMKKCLSSPVKKASNFFSRLSTYSTVQYLSYSFVAQNFQTVRLLDYFIISYQTWRVLCSCDDLFLHFTASICAARSAKAIVRIGAYVCTYITSHDAAS